MPRQFPGPYLALFSDHLPVHYRPVWADRTEIPADLCATCTDWDRLLLVPVSFCPQAARHCEQWYAHLAGAPEPDWYWLCGADASSQVLA